MVPVGLLWMKELIHFGDARVPFGFFICQYSWHPIQGRSSRAAERETKTSAAAEPLSLHNVTPCEHFIRVVAVGSLTYQRVVCICYGIGVALEWM